MNFGKKKKIGDILIEEGVIVQSQLENALKEQKSKKQKLGELFVDLGYTDEENIAKALSRQLKLEVVALAGKVIDPKVIELVNEQLLRRHMIMPFKFDDNNPNVLNVAMADPMDFIAYDDLSIVTNMKVEAFISTPMDIAATIDRYYGKAEVMAVAKRYSTQREKELQDNLNMQEAQEESEVNDSPIVQLIRSIIEQAVRQRASDIHIESLENQIRVRYRVDGVLYETMRYESNLLPAIVARIKIIGGMDISEKRKPQDGRLTMVVDRSEYDIRVSVLPTVYGEKIAMRISSNKNLSKAKTELGFSMSEMKKFNKILDNPHGIILITGPTGSGKSTTLYTALSELNKEGINIVTVEDPVEANIEGINQMQVNYKVGLTFANALRSILRQDPDIIMIGEIRDNDTAEIAIRASITGHLVVSTLHTNNAASAVTRLMDMGVDSYLIADATVGVIAQRLVRRLCPHCKEASLTTSLENILLKLGSESQEIYHPKGCNYCNNKGYFGRIGVYEIMPVTPSIKEVINEEAGPDKIQEIALKEGMNTLKESAANLVLNGITSISELKRIIYE